MQARIRKLFQFLAIAALPGLAGLMAPMDKAHATSCVPGVGETLQVTAQSLLVNSQPVDVASRPVEVSSISRSVFDGMEARHYCVFLQINETAVGLEHVEVIEPTPAAQQMLQELESRRTPPARICGSLPYRAIHPGVYKDSVLCRSGPGPDGADSRLDLSTIKLTVDESRAFVALEFSKGQSSYAVQYRVSASEFPSYDEGPTSCSFTSSGERGLPMALSLMGLCLFMRRRRVQ